MNQRPNHRLRPGPIERELWHTQFCLAFATVFLLAYSVTFFLAFYHRPNTTQLIVITGGEILFTILQVAFTFEYTRVLMEQYEADFGTATIPAQRTGSDS